MASREYDLNVECPECGRSVTLIADSQRVRCPECYHVIRRTSEYKHSITIERGEYDRLNRLAAMTMETIPSINVERATVEIDETQRRNMRRLRRACVQMENFYTGENFNCVAPSRW